VQISVHTTYETEKYVVVVWHKNFFRKILFVN